MSLPSAAVVHGDIPGRCLPSPARVRRGLECCARTRRAHVPVVFTRHNRRYPFLGCSRENGPCDRINPVIPG